MTTQPIHDDDQPKTIPGTTSPMSNFERQPNNLEQSDGESRGPADLTPEEMNAFEEAYGISGKDEEPYIVRVEHHGEEIPLEFPRLDERLDALSERVMEDVQQRGLLKSLLDKARSAGVGENAMRMKAAATSAYVGHEIGQLGEDWTREQAQKYAETISEKVGAGLAAGVEPEIERIFGPVSQGVEVAQALANETPWYLSPFFRAKEGIGRVVEYGVERVKEPVAEYSHEILQGALERYTDSVVAHAVDTAGTVGRGVFTGLGFLGSAVAIGGPKGVLDEILHRNGYGVVGESIDAFFEQEQNRASGESSYDSGPRAELIARVEALIDSGDFNGYSPEQRQTILDAYNEAQASLLRESVQPPEIVADPSVAEAVSHQEQVAEWIIAGREASSEKDIALASQILTQYKGVKERERKAGDDILEQKSKFTAILKSTSGRVANTVAEYTWIPTLLRMARYPFKKARDMLDREPEPQAA